MGNESAIQIGGDWDIKSQDLRQYYAGFTRRALPEGAIWRLSLAQSCLPAGHIGYKAWLTVVAGTERFCPELQTWALGLAETIASMKPRLRKNAREYVPSYRKDWGERAALDGLIWAIFGDSKVEPVSAQAANFGCDREAYRRIRDFVAGAILLAIWQYEDALRWAHRVARDA